MVPRHPWLPRRINAGPHRSGPQPGRNPCQVPPCALFEGGQLEIVESDESEDFGLDWESTNALTDFGVRERTEAWVWEGKRGAVTGRSWGGCFEVIDQLAIADRLPSVESLQGTILLLESSEEIPSAAPIRRWVRALGERGALAAVVGIMVAQPPASTREYAPPSEVRSQIRAAQCEAAITEITRYNEDAVVCVGIPFAHTRPQWILPYGGRIRMDGLGQAITAYYS